MIMRVFFYVIFTLIAAPIESWAYLLHGWGFNRPELVSVPYQSGLLYVLAIVLLGETIFRIACRWDAVKSRRHPITGPILKAIMCLSVIIGVPTTLFYLLVERTRLVTETQLVDDAGSWQRWILAASLLFAWASFFILDYIERRERMTGDRNLLG